MMILRSKPRFPLSSLLVFQRHTQIPTEKLIKMFTFFQTAQDNIDLQTTILSRFDLIFIVKDIRMYSQDKVISNYLAQMKCFTLGCTLALQADQLS